MKNAGDLVTLGEPIVELETDKVNLEVPAPAAGVLSRIDHAAGADVKIGEVIGIIDEAASAPASAGPAAESQWRGQTFERDRQARDLSAQILRSDQEYRTVIRR